MYKKELKSIQWQLKQYNSLLTEKKIDVSLNIKNIEMLSAEINKLIDMYVTEHREKVRADNSIRQAIANISHDLRTPLTSIKGYLQMIESKNLNDSEKREYLNTAIERSNHLEKLINDFFELSKIESHDYILNKERINITQLVNETVLSFYNSFTDRNIEPFMNIGSDRIFIFTDRAAVTRVIENLLSNAIRYSDGEISIGVMKENDRVILRIANSTEISGEENNPEMFFDRFYTADKSRTGKSTGLGLSIVKSLMDKMNGDIHAEYDGHKLTFTCEWRTAD